MTSTSSAGTCLDENCPIANGGSCRLGHADPIECDQFEPADSIADDEEPESVGPGESAPQSPRGHQQLQLSDRSVQLHSGHALTTREATRVRQERRTNVVLPIGLVDVGKTTLLAGIYEMFARGTSSPLFAGSLSLIGFEERCFLSTAASGRAVEDTDRTSRDADRILLHLKVKEKGVLSDLLVADVSGEYAAELARYNDLGAYESLLASTTHVLLLFDGQRLASNTQRHLTLNEARTLIRALAESKAVRIGTSVICVVTKGDCVPDDSNSTTTLDELRRVMHRYFPDSQMIVVSARSTDTVESAARSGLPQLLAMLLAPVTHDNQMHRVQAPAGRASHAFASGSVLLDLLTIEAST